MIPTKKEELERRLPGSAARRLSFAEYAAERHVSVDTVKRMVKRGELKVERVGLKCVRIVMTDR